MEGVKVEKETTINLTHRTDPYGGRATIEMSLHKEPTKEERDLIAEASETFFEQISKILEKSAWTN